MDDIDLGQNGLSVNIAAAFDDQDPHIACIITKAREPGADRSPS